MTHYYCTYFDSRYLIRGLALISSLKRNAGNYHLFVVCLDDFSFEYIKTYRRESITAISLKEIEKDDFDLGRAKRNRTPREYIWTLTPTVLLKILYWFQYIDVITYLDADLFFYSSPEPIFTELEGYSVLIHEHRFSPNLADFEKYGRYNVGLLCFKRDDNSFAVLSRWRNQCNECCVEVLKDGKFGDQVYLNEWPDIFVGIKILENIGAGVAPWNHEQYSFKKNNNGQVLVNGHPLIFYHFHSFAIVNSAIFVPVDATHYSVTNDIITHCFLEYIECLIQAILDVRSKFPLFDTGINQHEALKPDITFLANSGICRSLKNLYPRHSLIDINKDWGCFGSIQLKHNTNQSDIAAFRSDYKSIGYMHVEPYLIMFRDKIVKINSSNNICNILRDARYIKILSGVARDIILATSYDKLLERLLESSIKGLRVLSLREADSCSCDMSCTFEEMKQLVVGNHKEEFCRDLIPYILIPKPPIEAGMKKLRVGLALYGGPDGAEISSECVVRSIPPQKRYTTTFVFFPAAVHPDGKVPDCLDYVDARSVVHDYSDLAALVGSLDILIGFENDMVHLAGALGKPVSLLLPAFREWCWMEHGGHSLWYPTVSIVKILPGRDVRYLAQLIAEEVARNFYTRARVPSK